MSVGGGGDGDGWCDLGSLSFEKQQGRGERGREGKPCRRIYRIREKKVNNDNNNKISLICVYIS